MGILLPAAAHTRCQDSWVTPFRDNGRLTRQQNKFNTQLSRRRVVVERVRLLSGRFSPLKFLKLWGIADTVRTILAAGVFHSM